MSMRYINQVFPTKHNKNVFQKYFYKKDVKLTEHKFLYNISIAFVTYLGRCFILAYNIKAQSLKILYGEFCI